ncbi:MAG: hypothetical protein AB1Z65_07810, partial [Candidatus Sulfomarinibacteraceae bacterium]
RCAMAQKCDVSVSPSVPVWFNCDERDAFVCDGFVSLCLRGCGVRWAQGFGDQEQRQQSEAAAEAAPANSIQQPSKPSALGRHLTVVNIEITNHCKRSFR